MRFLSTLSSLQTITKFLSTPNTPGFPCMKKIQGKHEVLYVLLKYSFRGLCFQLTLSKTSNRFFFNISLLYSFKIQITISYAKHSFNWRNPQSLNSVCTSLLSNFYLWTNIINSKTLPNSIFTSIRFFIQHVCTSPAFKYQRKEERDSRVKDLDRLSIFFVIITKSLTSSLTNTITELFYTRYTKTSSWKHWALHATKQLITHFQQLRLLQNLWSFITVACLDFSFLIIIQMRNIAFSKNFKQCHPLKLYFSFFYFKILPCLSFLFGPNGVSTVLNTCWLLACTLRIAYRKQGVKV